MPHRIQQLMPAGLPGALRVGGQTAPLWLLLCLQGADYFLKRQQDAVVAPICPLEDFAKLELATCRAELIGALSCAVPEAAVPADEEKQWGNLLLQAIGALCSALGALSCVVRGVCECCRARRRDVPRRVRAASAPPEDDFQDDAQAQAGGRRRCRGHAVVV